MELDTATITVDMSEWVGLQVMIMYILRAIGLYVMPRAVIKVGAVTRVTCLMDGNTLLHAVSVTTITISVVDTDKYDLLQKES